VEKREMELECNKMGEIIVREEKKVREVEEKEEEEV
jgi:hypothetical protein